MKTLFTKNFTLLVLGQVSSLFGNLILRFALSMYVLEKTGSASVFAGILAIATVPAILLFPFGGILADRANRRNIMVALDALTGISVLLAVLFFSERSGIPVIAVLLTVFSVLGAFETPAVQACVPQMQTGENIIRGNAVVNQIAAVSTLVAPLLGSAFYAAFGLKPVMLASIFCFFLTAAFECFIDLEWISHDIKTGILKMVNDDFLDSVRFMCREQPGIFKMLLFVALTRFFVMGTAMIGLPYIVRTVLGLRAGHYGVAESALAVAAILGGILSGLLTGKLKIHSLASVLALLGVFMLPAGMVFLFPVGVNIRYGVNVAAFCGVQIAATVYSVFAVSLIQQRTPNALLGKIMAYTAAVTLCVQPFGQILYGFLFDVFRERIALVLIPTGLIVCCIGWFSTGFFRDLEAETRIVAAELRQK